MVTELVLSAIALIGIAIIVPLFMLATTVFGPRAGGKAKNDPYESGVKQMIGLAEQKFSVKFYLLACIRGLSMFVNLVGSGLRRW
jgi:NADH-quinone oxidoreductase subunit A